MTQKRVSSAPLGIEYAFVAYASYALCLQARTTILYVARLSFSVLPRKIIRAGAGIFACFPSTTLFSLALGTD